MKTRALYLTTYNHPAMLERLIASGLLKDVDRAVWDVIVFDQSDDKHAAAYAVLARAGGFEHVRNENKGASAAKRAQIQHAYLTGRDWMAQVSEDFVLSPEGAAPVDWLANGRDVFFQAAQDVLTHRPRLAFCCWAFAMEQGSAFWYEHLKRISNLTFHKASRLAHVEGDVMALGWPYTARVHDMMKLVVETQKPEHFERMQGPDGGEGVLAAGSLGKGACLCAMPVIHDRAPHIRPANRQP